MEAFEAAVALGVRNLETDVHVTCDGQLVAFHNPKLDGVTDRKGKIKDLTLAEVEAADAGYGYTRDRGCTYPFRGRGLRIPRFEQLLARWPDAYLSVEPKDDDCVHALSAVIDEHGAWDRIGIGSFSDRRLDLVRSLSRGRACTSIGLRANLVAQLRALTGRGVPRQGADFLQVSRRLGPFPAARAGFVRAAHRAGLPVHVWTVNREATMHKLLDVGVDGIITDRPRILRDVIASRRP